jgi:hypothetical protein
MVASGAEPSKTHWTLRDWIAAALLFAATAGVVLWQNAHVAALFDIGYILDVAARIAAGQQPYRDFPLVHAPLTFLFQAAIIRLTGRVFFHHVLYVAVTGGLATVLTWRIALHTLRDRIAVSWTVALLLAAPLSVVGIYCILPNPEYDSDCAFWILVAVWALQRVGSSTQQFEVHPERGLPRQSESKNPHGSSLQHQSRRANAWFPGLLRKFLTGIALVIPLFFKQNMGLPFLVTAVGAILVLLVVPKIRSTPAAGGETTQPPLLAVLGGACASLLAGALALQFTIGIGNYVRWTIHFAAQRRMPGLDAMAGIYLYPSLAWMLPCALAGLLLLRWHQGIRTSRFTVHGPRPTLHESRSTSLWAQLIAFVLLASPFVYALSALFLYDDADERGDSFLAVWPVLLLLAAATALINLFRERRHLTLRLFVPFLLLAAIHGTMMSQQLWGSTYAIWPLLLLLLAEMLVSLHGFASSAGACRWFAPALAAFISITLLVCGGFYTTSEERLSYVQLPTAPPAHSAFPALAGMATPGPFLPEFDELLRYATANIPFHDGIMLPPGEEPFFFATGRKPQFPATIWDNTCDPYSPAEIADLARTRHIRWLIVKRDLQLNADPMPDRAATMDLLMRQFTLVTHLHGYDVYRANSRE